MLRFDPSDVVLRKFSSKKDSFKLTPSPKRDLVPSSPAKETPKATITPQVSPTPSTSVQRDVEFSKNDEGILESCQSLQGHTGHSILSQGAQETHFSTKKHVHRLPRVSGNFFTLL